MNTFVIFLGVMTFLAIAFSSIVIFKNQDIINNNILRIIEELNGRIDDEELG